MAYVAAYTVSSYANTATRNGKPFNPLLGETYECDRMDESGWRSVAEQVRDGREGRGAGKGGRGEGRREGKRASMSGREYGTSERAHERAELVKRTKRMSVLSCAQVCHHPPTLALHAEGKSGWTAWQEFTMSSKFRGKYLSIIPLGE